MVRTPLGLLKNESTPASCGQEMGMLTFASPLEPSLRSRQRWLSKPPGRSRRRPCPSFPSRNDRVSERSQPRPWSRGSRGSPGVPNPPRARAFDPGLSAGVLPEYREPILRLGHLVAGWVEPSSCNVPVRLEPLHDRRPARSSATVAVSGHEQQSVALWRLLKDWGSRTEEILTLGCRTLGLTLCLVLVLGVGTSTASAEWESCTVRGTRARA